MIDEKNSLIPPAVFIPAAERYSMMSTLDRWVIESAFAYCARAHAKNVLDTCAINLSGRSIGEEGLLAFIQKQFELFRIPPEMICFEITETAAISNLDKAIDFIAALKKIGCHFALDDFGSGMSSYAYLKQLPIDFLKIDGSFVKNIVDNPVDRAMVESINHIGHVMGIKTIAEFVENEAILMQLKKIGVDFAQGYGINRPHPLPEIS
jgi:EAL domain-containing protein (putative c-di-GMP-specific phosphodiesterase class I)